MLRLCSSLACALIVVFCAASSLAMAQSAYYDPQQGSGDGRTPVPHTGILNGKFWTDFRYRYEFVDQGNLLKDARASNLDEQDRRRVRLLPRLSRRRRRRICRRSRS
jgi:hypothetical protein